MKLDILAFAAHPDDVELSCSGTVIKHIQLGYKVGLVDLTRGELGTRGNAELRMREAEAASVILGIHARENLAMADGFFTINNESLTAVVRMIRKYQPKIVLANAVSDRHPDHGRASQLVREAFFLSGLIKFETSENGAKQNAWRPSALYFYIQDRAVRPDVIVDISGLMDLREQAIKSFSSQFYNPDSKEPETAISTKHFLDILKLRASDLGRIIGAEHGEGFTVERSPGVDDLFSLK